MNPIFDGRVVTGAIALAVVLAIMGTVLGARLHSEPGFQGEGGQPVYRAYGWPWAWKTNAPESLIAFWNDQGDERESGSAFADLTAWPEHGVRVFVFLGTTTMWFVAAVTAESVLWLVRRRLLRVRQRRTSAAGTVE
jgi:hypothetical protein